MGKQSMKTALSFIVALALCVTAKAGEIVVPASTIGELFTNVTFASNFTSATTFTNTQPCLFTVNHTFQLFYVGTGTNSGTAALDRTIDGTNWFTAQSYTIPSTTNIEYTPTGKWWAYRWRITVLATNASAMADYMAE